MSFPVILSLVLLSIVLIILLTSLLKHNTFLSMFLIALLLGVALHLDSEAGRVLTTLAMGAGSMAVSHANDSYFWVVAKFSGLETKPTLRVYTTSTLILGLSTFLAIWLCSLFWLKEPIQLPR